MQARRQLSAAVWPSAVKKRLDVLPNWDRKLKLQRAHLAAYWRAWEDSEVARLSRTASRPPRAEVAVVVPTYRRPALLQRAVLSVLAQSFEDVVVVVVDDGGGQVDGLPDDPRVHLRALRRNTAVLGVVNNVGIRVSRSRYVAVLNDDNVWRPDHLARAVAALQAGPDIVYTGMCRRRSDDSVVDHLAVPYDRGVLRRSAYIDSSALVFRRLPGLHFSRVPRGRADIPMEDWEFVWRYGRRHRVELVPDVTVDYLIHEGTYFTDWDLFWRRRAAAEKRLQA